MSETTFLILLAVLAVGMIVLAVGRLAAYNGKPTEPDKSLWFMLDWHEDEYSRFYWEEDDDCGFGDFQC
ncbi:MAG: hypothetical protein FWE95_07825 [Planctomycetaceae bacterium]|nr:hypothetical protein [Planctomycetaceae bacterium]